MRVLALDTALGAVSLGVFDFPQGTILGHHRQDMDRGHAEELIPAVRDLMETIEGGFPSLDRIVVTVGPGSFTGLRIAIAAARSFGLALKIPVVGVSTLVAYAAPLISEGARMTIASAIDARHGAVFFQSFWMDGRRAFGPEVIPVADAVRELRGGPATLTGTGAEAVAAEARRQGIMTVVADSGPCPEIAWVARLGAAADPESAPSRPLYLRDASATPSFRGRIARLGV